MGSFYQKTGSSAGSTGCYFRHQRLTVNKASHLHVTAESRVGAPLRSTKLAWRIHMHSPSQRQALQLTQISTLSQRCWSSPAETQ
jgi:hypothetical protein